MVGAIFVCSLESFQQEARLSAEEHAEGERMPQRRRLAFSIFEEQAPRIRHKAVGFRAESVITAEAAHIFHTPIGRVHAREAAPSTFSESVLKNGLP